MHRRVLGDARGLHLTLRQSDALAGFLCICQRAAPDAEAVRCTGGFSMMPERLHPDDRVHWRVSDIARELHLTLRRSGALAGLTMMPERLYLTLRQSDTLAGFRFLTQAGRQAGGRDRRQAGRARRQMRRCLLTAKAGKLIREKMVKNSDSVVKLLRNVLNRLQQTVDRETFRERARNLKKKNKRQ